MLLEKENEKKKSREKKSELLRKLKNNRTVNNWEKHRMGEKEVTTVEKI